MTLKEIDEKVRGMGLYVGDQVKVTNRIRRRLHLEIIQQTFLPGDTSYVRVLPSGETWGVGKVELMEWLAQPDTEVIRLGTGKEAMR